MSKKYFFLILASLYGKNCEFQIGKVNYIRDQPFTLIVILNSSHCIFHIEYVQLYLSDCHIACKKQTIKATEIQSFFL